VQQQVAEMCWEELLEELCEGTEELVAARCYGRAAAV
jgi:hypothetical protein